MGGLGRKNLATQKGRAVNAPHSQAYDDGFFCFHFSPSRPEMNHKKFVRAYLTNQLLTLILLLRTEK